MYHWTIVLVAWIELGWNCITFSEETVENERFKRIINTYNVLTVLFHSFNMNIILKKVVVLRISLMARFEFIQIKILSGMYVRVSMYVYKYSTYSMGIGSPLYRNRTLYMPY
jgi:hypothetical protein